MIATAAAVDAMNQMFSSRVLQHSNRQYKMNEQSVFLTLVYPVTSCSETLPLQ